MEQISNVNQVKQHNLLQIKRVLRQEGTATKHTIAGLTGLSVATCNNLLNELFDCGEIIMVGNEATTIGRPAKAYMLNPEYAHICTMWFQAEDDLQLLKYTVVDLLGNSLEEGTRSYQKLEYAHMEQLIEELLQKFPKLKTFSIGIPGFFDGQLTHCNFFDAFQGLNLLGLLSGKFPCHFLLENDMNAIAYGLYCEQRRKGAAPDSLVILGHFRETDSGSGIVLNGKIFSGASHFAGEVIFLPGYKQALDIEDTSAKTAGACKETVVLDNLDLAVRSFCAVLNPSMIILTGSGIHAALCEEIIRRCKKSIPAPHLPRISYLENYTESYKHGLFDLVIDHDLY